MKPFSERSYAPSYYDDKERTFLRNKVDLQEQLANIDGGSLKHEDKLLLYQELKEMIEYKIIK